RQICERATVAPGGWLRISARASIKKVGPPQLSDRGAPTLKKRKTLDTTGEGCVRASLGNGIHESHAVLNFLHIDYATIYALSSFDRLHSGGFVLSHSLAVEGVPEFLYRNHLFFNVTVSVL